MGQYKMDYGQMTGLIFAHSVPYQQKLEKDINQIYFKFVHKTVAIVPIYYWPLSLIFRLKSHNCKRVLYMLAILSSSI